MGLVYSLIQQCVPPKPQFSINDIPDLSGKTVIVTGASTGEWPGDYSSSTSINATQGIGKETVKVLLSHNAKVYIVGRNREKTEHTIAELKEVTGREAQFIECDLADLESIKAAAEIFTSREQELHVLINNAGVMFPPVSELTVQGYDSQLGTNVLGHFYLTKLLLPILMSTTKTSGNKVRVVTVSSIAHHFGNIDFSTLRDSPARRRWGVLTLYTQSKFADIVFAAELGRKYGDQGIVSITLNPGNIRTELGRHLPSLVMRIAALFCYPASTGALSQLYAATDPGAEKLNGKYLIPWARLGEPKQSALDPQLGKEFWEWCEEQVKDI
ncbi:hypothetical protein AX15_002412 [Amanita polypyramis BW_CC]|nr:hypothetical protein AX15_002412 [Amanita polypyramis BW_CC]